MNVESKTKCQYSSKFNFTPSNQKQLLVISVLRPPLLNLAHKLKILKTNHNIVFKTKVALFVFANCQKRNYEK